MIFVFGSPANGLLGLALLGHKLGYFNILRFISSSCCGPRWRSPWRCAILCSP